MAATMERVPKEPTAYKITSFTVLIFGF